LREHKIDIDCITETHLVLNEKFNILSYKIHRQDRISNVAAGGVAILLSNRIIHQPAPCPNSANFETITVTVTIERNDYIIIAAYKPPKKQFPLNEYREIFNNNPNVILLGDLNSKNQAWGCNCTTQQGINLQSIAISSSVDIIAPWQPTHYPYNSSVIPDILDIMVSKNFHLPIIQTVLPELDSDHCPVLI